MANDDRTKRAALSLLARGLVSRTEAAKLAGVSKQLMGHWAKDLDVEKAREAALAKLWARTPH